MTSKPKSLYSILCVDDEADLLDIVADKIEALGFNPLKANSPSEALKILQSKNSEIIMVLSDFQMPEMDGYELRKKILNLYKTIPFVLMSAHITREQALQAVELRISAFLPKPFDWLSFDQVLVEQSKDRMDAIKEDAELLEGFVSDAEMLLEEMESLLLELDVRQPDPQVLNRIFAIAHTIKGASGFFKPDIVNKFTHKLEDFFSPYKKLELPLNETVLSILLKGTDTVKQLVAALKNHEADRFHLDELLQQFDLKKAQHFATRATTELKSNSEKPISPPMEAKREEVRVEIQLLDEFMGLSGEITVIRNMINKLVATIEKESGSNRNVNHLSELLDEMHKINATLQDKIVELRKVPIRNIFRPLNRTIRDLSNTLKKEIDIEFLNDSLKVDTSIAEVLSNSLIHMVRNSADHGIEMPADRIASGKPSLGKIKVAAKQVSEEIIVDISDDGKGLNTEFLRKKIVEKGLKTEAQARAMSVKDIQAMIFESGFSTAATITDVSGRGVGMDMVKKSIERIGGRIDIESEIGKGSRFSLILPVPKSVTIISSVLVQIKNEICGIPQDSIVRLVNLDGTDSNIQIRKLEGADCILLDGILYPLIELSSAFNDDQVIRKNARILIEPHGKIVLVKANATQYGIFVDEILDLEDTVVKKLGRHFANQPQYLGATFLGDSSVSLIINTIGLAEMYGINTQEPLKQDKLTHKTDTEVRPVNDILLFTLGTQGLYGVNLKQVYRLEKFQTKDIQFSGEQPVCIYRGATMPIYCLNALLEFTAETTFNTKSQEPIATLVLESKGRYIGIAVKEITDLVQSNAVTDTQLSDRIGIEGASIINDTTVTILNLIDAIEGRKTSVKETPALAIKPSAHSEQKSAA